jgi:hypothetical protein
LNSPAVRLLAAGWALMWAGVSLAGNAAGVAENNPAENGLPGVSSQIRELLDVAVKARQLGDREREFGALAQVLDLDSSHSNTHARLAEMTGLAQPVVDPEGLDPVELALQHPYDPRALVAAAAWLERADRTEGALEFLERAVWLADLDPEAGLAALRGLRKLNQAWRGRRIVPVHVHADASIRARYGWQFRMRTLWLSVSTTLDSVLETRFVPVVIDGFEVGEESDNLDAIHEAFVKNTPAPSDGILAAMTEQAVSESAIESKEGVAEFLGRSLAVRVSAGATESRVLAHEVLHLYGAIHVLDGVDTLMNPTGSSLVLDRPSIRIVRALRFREFGEGGIEENILPSVALRETVNAYRAALSVNLSMR